MKLTELADILGLDIKITRYANQNGRYCAGFAEMVESKRNKTDCILGSTQGYGSSPKEAMSDMAENIRGKWLVINPGDKLERREFGVPQLDGL